MNIADQSMFLAISRFLWAFRFEKVLDDSGKELVPDARAVTQGSLVQPLPFPVNILPRSELHSKTVRKEWESMQNLLDGEKQWLEVPEGMLQARS